GYAANVELCVRSYLDVAWDEQAEGWHHTLSDPWGPRYEPRLANQLWRYGCWPGGDPLQRVRARDQVRRAIARARQKDRLSAPHLDLALVYGHVADAVEATATIAHKWMTDQQPDGSWAWTPDVVQNVADFKTQDRLARMGAEHDSATGLTSTRALSVLPFALLTGDPDAVGAIRNATDWCNRQRRPEGAQTWELHLHVPDVLAVPYLIDLNLGAYELTGDATYLQAAQRWAWTGLPFTYLWNGWYRPVMRYGTVPVFGVTFHDVQPWFGVIVQWNGLVYADALWRLARYSPAEGPIDWRSLAEGITQHGMQEQMTSGPNQGMYPDAYSPVRGDEEYTWWLNPQLIGLNTFPLAGLRVHLDHRVLRPQDGPTLYSTPKYITSGAEIAHAQSSKGQLQLTLLDWPGATSFTLLGGLATAPAQVTCEGVSLPRVEEVDGVDAGWQWLAGHRMAVVKLCHTQPGLGVSVMV
ncbi:MAG: hypothetical protein M1546_06960, partial [Chloroflexi bacterium]|nr:hypothetical protein [Chloroflexota bacterium]